jgi:hypothetical protein
LELVGAVLLLIDEMLRGVDFSHRPLGYELSNPASIFDSQLRASSYIVFYLLRFVTLTASGAKKIAEYSNGKLSIF